MRECGLKQTHECLVVFDCEVTPHAGVWIETRSHITIGNRGRVTPHAGVWIETKPRQCILSVVKSLPMRECGLKPPLLLIAINATNVTPHAGVWIETIAISHLSARMSCHSPCGSVD